MKTINGQVLKRIFISGSNNLYNFYPEIDALNVFPVPDGDTGMNMNLTLSSGCKEIKNNDEKKLNNDGIDNLINKLRSDNKFYYSVYTKHEYEPLFLSLGFSKIASTDKVSMLEFGSPKIDEVMDRLKVKIESTLDCKLDESKVACVVANANPFTNGHLSLVEEAIYRRYDYIIVFIVQENKSYFSEKERMALAYVSLLPYDNVVVVPSTRYMVSSMTFSFSS